MTLCQNCLKREGTEIWVGEGGALAYIHGGGARWCMRCVLENQLAYALARAADVERLKKGVIYLTPLDSLT